MTTQTQHDDLAETVANAVLRRLIEAGIIEPKGCRRGRKNEGDGYTPREAARYLRISPDRVRALIVKGDLGAINTATVLCGRPRYKVLPHHLRAFEEGRKAKSPEMTSRRRKRPDVIDFYT